MELKSGDRQKKAMSHMKKIEPRSREKRTVLKAFVAAVTDEERIKQRRIIKNRIGNSMLGGGTWE